MKKKVYGRKLSRGFNARKALFRALVRAIVIYGSIETTKAKAKSVQSDIDKLITLAKRGGLNERRRVFAHLGNDRLITDKLFKLAKSSFSSRKSGFTRIIKLPRRKGDAAEMVRFEWTDKVEISDKKKEKRERVQEKKKAKKEVKGSKKGETRNVGTKRGLLKK